MTVSKSLAQGPQEVENSSSKLYIFSVAFTYEPLLNIFLSVFCHGSIC